MVQLSSRPASATFPHVQLPIYPARYHDRGRLVHRQRRDEVAVSILQFSRASPRLCVSFVCLRNERKRNSSVSSSGGGGGVFEHKAFANKTQQSMIRTNKKSKPGQYTCTTLDATAGVRYDHELSKTANGKLHETTLQYVRQVWFLWQNV